MQLMVEKVSGDSTVQVGAVWRLTQVETVLGRDPRCDIVIDHPRVSRRHARFSLRSDGVSVENLSRYTSYHNKAPFTGSVPIADGDFLQFGGILLRARDELQATESMVGPMSLGVTSTDPPSSSEHTQEPHTPIVLCDEGTATAQFFGHVLELTPLTFRLLAALCRTPGTWLRYTALLQQMWPDDLATSPAYVNKYASLLRKSLSGVLVEHPEHVDALREALSQGADRYTHKEDVETGDIRELALELIKARKKIGFRLALSFADVRLLGR